MAYIKFRTLITESGESILEAEWFTEAEARDHFGTDEETGKADLTDAYDVYELELTDEQVAARNASCRAFWDFVYGDHVLVGSPEVI